MSSVISSTGAAAIPNGISEPSEARINAALRQDEAEKAALATKLQETQAGGARVLEFDENATPQQKAAQAAKAMDKIKPITKTSNGESAVGVVSDIGGKKVQATTNLSDLDKINKEERKNIVPGDMPAGHPASRLPDWYQVGWSGVLQANKGLSPNDTSLPEEAAHLDLVSTFLSDTYYGYFWWNGAVIFVAIFATYLSTRFGGGIGMLVIIATFCSTYYNTSIRRTRQRARDDITRELAKKRMLSENESAEWINNFLSRFWLIYEPVLSATVINIADQVLLQNCPAFLDSIRMTTFTLGTKAPRVDAVRTFPNTEDDIIMMDWKFNFTPSDTLDLTVKQASQKINPKIVLTVRVGRGVVGAGMPVLLEDINFVGHIRLKIKLMSTFPHVQTVDMCFMEPPKIDYVLKPIGGNTLGFDIGNIPGLSDFIQGQVHANLGPMMYHPNVFTLNLEEILSGTPLDTACGILQVTLWSARNLKGAKLGGGTPDPYVAISIDNKETLAKTSIKKSTSSPQFKETKFVLLNNLNGMLTLSLMDFNEMRPDSHLGQAAFELKDLSEDPEQENLSTPVMHDGKERGEIQYSLSYYPVIKPEVGDDGQPKHVPETRAGVVRLTLHQAKDLDKRSGFSGEPCPKARIRLNGQKVKDTLVIKRTTNPVFEMPAEFLVTERKKAVVTVEILDDRDLRSDTVIAHISIRLDDLLAAKQTQQDWFPLKDSKNGRLRMSAEWKPVLMSGSMSGSSGYTPAVGVIKFWMKKATDLKNVEAVIGGKSDPYVTVKLRGQLVGGTTIVNNNLHPEWNEIVYCPVHSLRERITIEVMDYQNTGKDRSLGTIELNVADLAAEAEEGDSKHKYVSTGKKSMKEKVHLGRGLYKGDLVFDCQFLPAVNLKGVEFEGAGNEAASKSGIIIEEEQPSQSLANSVNGSLHGDATKTDNSAVKVESNGQTKSTLDSSTDTSASRDNESDTASKTKEEVTAISMTKEELLASQSGIIVFNVLRGNLPHYKKHSRLEVLFDDGYWPAHTTEQARSAQCTWDEVGESTIKELDWSRFLLKLRTGDSDEDVFGEFSGSTKDVLEKTLNQEYEFRLSNHGGAHVASVTLTCKYIPMDLHLEPVESVNNQGFLRVDVIHARNLRAADRGNRSDPYFSFNLNGERMGKTKVVKKTLNPDYNEHMGEFQVTSRVAAEAMFEAFDFDHVGAPDKLGQAHVDLSVLEPFEPLEKTYPLIGKGAGENSQVTVRFVFRPEFVTNRERKGTSLSRTFTSGIAGVGRVGAGGVLGVGKAGLGVGKGVVGVAEGMVGKGVGGMTRGMNHLIRHNGRKNMGRTQSELSLVQDQFEEEEDTIINDGLPSSHSNYGIPIPPIPQDTTHHRTTSNDFDSKSIAESQAGTPKRKSRLHNPFKRH